MELNLDQLYILKRLFEHGSPMGTATLSEGYNFKTDLSKSILPLVKEGLIDKDFEEWSYGLTDKGRVYVGTLIKKINEIQID